MNSAGRSRHTRITELSARTNSTSGSAPVGGCATAVLGSRAPPPRPPPPASIRPTTVSSGTKRNSSVTARQNQGRDRLRIRRCRRRELNALALQIAREQASGTLPRGTDAGRVVLPDDASNDVHETGSSKRCSITEHRGDRGSRAHGKAPLCGAFQSPLRDSSCRPPPYHAEAVATDGNR